MVPGDWGSNGTGMVINVDLVCVASDIICHMVMHRIVTVD